VADNGKGQDPTTAGNKGRGTGGRRQCMQLINTYSNKFKALWHAATVIVVITCISIVVIVVAVILL
jgi:hypothetical protein